MRIRKLASKILGTASSVACQLSSSPPSSSPAPAAGLLQAYYFCELNRSPWDVLPFPPLPPRLPLDRPPNPKMEEEGGGNVGNEIKEEPMPGIASAQTRRKDEYDDEEHDNEKKKKRKGRTSTDHVLKRKTRVKKDLGPVEANSEVVITCKKTDGKKWRCKRPAHHPNSFCHYHLTQLRSYSYTANNNRVPAGDSDKSRRRRRRLVAPTASMVKDSGSFYYYSPFGPWRGRRRGGDSAQTVAADEEEKQEKEQEEEPDDGNIVNEDVVVDDDDDDNEEDDDDSEGENGMDEEKRKHKRNTRKKGRKPVKARSLKSLL